MSNLLKLSIASVIVMTCCSNSFAKFTTKGTGDFTQVIVPVYALGTAVNKNDEEGINQFMISFLATQASVHGLKCVIDAERPDGKDNKSFPSGHTASAFSGATFIHKRYGMEKAVVPYLLAGFTGYSRIHSNKHYFHDVAAAALISSFFTWMFVDEYSGVQVSVSPEPSKLGLRVVFR